MTETKARKRGYTAVELLMSIGVLGIGVTGVVAMQKVTITSNQHAKNLAIATQVGQAWMEQLRADALQWNHPSAAVATSDIQDTLWLKEITGNNANGAWLRPAWEEEREFGPGFDAQGRPTNVAAATRFCTNLRLTWLYGSNVGVAGNQLIRAEVRVYWLRDGQAPLDNDAFCTEDPALVGGESGRPVYHAVYDVSAIRQNTLD